MGNWQLCKQDISKKANKFSNTNMHAYFKHCKPSTNPNNNHGILNLLQNLIWKSQTIVKFEANLTHLGAKAVITAVTYWPWSGGKTVDRSPSEPRLSPADSGGSQSTAARTTGEIHTDCLLYLTADPPENCHLTVKKLPKTWLFFF